MNYMKSFNRILVINFTQIFSYLFRRQWTIFGYCGRFQWKRSNYLPRTTTNRTIRQFEFKWWVNSNIFYTVFSFITIRFNSKSLIEIFRRFFVFSAQIIWLFMTIKVLIYCFIYFFLAPNFVSSITKGDFVYFFFRETAVEYINCGKVSCVRHCINIWNSKLQMCSIQFECIDHQFILNI